MKESVSKRINNLPELTDEQRKEMREKASESKRIAKEYAEAHLKVDYLDEPHWRELASRAGIKLPTYYIPATELKYVKRAAKKIGVDISGFVASTGCTTLKDLAAINPKSNAVQMVGLFLEYCEGEGFINA